MRKLARPTHATIVAYLALVVAVGGVGGTAYAATGGTFLLGKSNTANATTTLARTTKGPALTLKVPTGAAPLAVTSTGKVVKLNSDLLDGKDSTAFQPKIGPLVWTPLTPAAGWQGNCYQGAPGVAKSADGVVRFHGDVCATTSPAPSTLIFTLPAQFRPSKLAYIVVDECGGSTGRIIIYPTGDVEVQGDPQSTPANSSECFTSLAGVSYTLPY